MIEKRKKLCKCGCNQLGFYWRSGYLKGHSPKEKTSKSPIKKMSSKKTEEITENNNYYRKAIALNIVKNKGKCICEECGIEILNPKGSHVSHILSKGSQPALYHNILNHKILCIEHHQMWETGDRKSMKIYDECMKIKEQLTREYYESN